MNMNKYLDIALNLVFPPVCVSCKETLPFDSHEALCQLCRSRYESEKNFICPECSVVHRDCTCMPPKVSRHAVEAIHLAEYLKEDSVVRDMVLFAKNERNAYLYRFLSSELATLLSSRIDLEGVLVTFVPRSAQKEAKFGVDQAKEAARRMAKNLRCEFLPLFYHQKSKEQKHLSVFERAANAKNTYGILPKNSHLIRGRRVVLYDDVMTSGATAAVCASLLKRAGASEVIVLTFAKTYPKQKQKSASLPRKKQTYKVKKSWFW